MGEILLEGYNFKFQSIPTDKISKKNEPQILKRKSNTEKNLTMNEKWDQNQESEMPDIWYWDY